MTLQHYLGFYNTPPLWIKKQFGVSQFEFPVIRFADFVPREIPKKLRLGHKMEYVFQQLLEHSATYQVVCSNVVVKDASRTIGELDYILQNRVTKAYIHIELTYKFYLINPAISEPIHRLMGPNKKDMVFTKLEKLKTEQFQLPYTNEARTLLEAYNIPVDALEHEACFKAQLFIPYGNSRVSIRPMNLNCIAGYWIPFDAFNSPTFAKYTYYIPYKIDRVLHPHEEVEWISHYQILLEVNLRMIKQNSPMLWVRKPDATIEKCFVVWW